MKWGIGCQRHLPATASAGEKLLNGFDPEASLHGPEQMKGGHGQDRKPRGFQDPLLPLAGDLVSLSQASM